jgi:hemerythrin superfamily protein
MATLRPGSPALPASASACSPASVARPPSSRLPPWRLKAEHKLARAIFEKLSQTTDEQKPQRATLLLQLQHAIGKHNVQEEYVVYCVLRQTGQVDAADELHAEHGDLKQGLFDLEMIGKEQRSGFLERLAQVRTAFEDHVRAEEDEIFPRLHAALSPEAGKAATNRMNREGFKVA